MKKKILLALISMLVLCSCDAAPPNAEVQEQSRGDTENPPAMVEQEESIIEDDKNSVIEHQEQIPGNFRYAKWGMTKEEVINSEIGIEVIEQQGHLFILDEQVLDKPAIIMFEMENDKLVGGMFNFTIKHSEKNLYYNDYQSIVKSYTEKYGEPDSVEEVWINNLYRDKPDKIGMAIAAGHLQIKTSWNIDTTDIHVIITGDNYNIGIAVLYADTKREEKVNTDGI